jgi:hypothetical protein
LAAKSSLGREEVFGELPMCEKCVELDNKIEHYRRLSLLITDEKTVEQLGLFIEKWHAEKAALHPESQS